MGLRFMEIPGALGAWESDENCSRLFPAMSGHILKLRDVIAVVGGDTWGWQWAVLISRTVLLLTLM